MKTDNVEVGVFGNRFNPEQMILELEPKLKRCKEMVVVFLDENDYVQTYWTSGSNLKHVGMLHVGIEALIDSGRGGPGPPPEEES